MLYHLLTAFVHNVGFFRVFRYPSFRVPAAALTALCFTLWLFPRFIEMLKRWQQGASNVREYTPDTHKKKEGTPTMGGLFILIAMLGTSVLWCDLSNVYVWAVVIVTAGFGAIGFIDDYRKIIHKNSKGLAGRYKLLWQLATLVMVTGLLFLGQQGVLGAPIHFDTRLSIPFVSVRLFHPDMGLLYLPFAYLVVIGTSNAVNLTDGLDGLAIGPAIVSSMTFGMLAYTAGLVLSFFYNGAWVDFNVATYLNMPHIKGIGELAVVCASMAGAGIGFLWFNAFPASVFMGDVGALAIGGALGMVAVLTKNEVLSAVIHGVFLVEALSVITQVISFKTTGKRIFRMAPIHHHFEQLGWREPTIVIRFWIISVVLALIGLSTLKLR